MDRIQSIEQVHTPFIENSFIADFDEYFEDIVGVSFPAERVVEHIVLRFSHHRFPYIVAKPIHGSQKIVSAEKRIISIDVMPNRELESIILSFGEDVEVIEPQSFRKTIVNKIKKSYEVYLSMQNDCTDSAYLCNVERKSGEETAAFDDKRNFQPVQKDCTNR